MGAATSTRATALGLSVALAATLSACATARGRTEGPTVPIAVEVQNNLSRPADLTVYAVTRSGNRTILGDSPPGSTKTFTFTPVSFSEPYRFLATGAARRGIQSASFNVMSDATTRLVWTLVPNIVGFEQTDPDSTSP